MRLRNQQKGGYLFFKGNTKENGQALFIAYARSGKRIIGARAALMATSGDSTPWEDGI
jgi:hypothetical protein